MPDEVKLVELCELKPRVMQAIHEARFRSPGRERDPEPMDLWDEEYCGRLADAAIVAIEVTRPTAATDDVVKELVEALLEKHIQRCRDAVSECGKWSPAQAEWSRARDALLNFKDDLAKARTGVTLNG